MTQDKDIRVDVNEELKWAIWTFGDGAMSFRHFQLENFLEEEPAQARAILRLLIKAKLVGIIPKKKALIDDIEGTRSFQIYNLTKRGWRAYRKIENSDPLSLLNFNREEVFEKLVAETDRSERLEEIGEE